MMPTRRVARAKGSRIGQMTTPQDKNGDSRKTASFTDLVRKVALASVGAVVLAQEELEDFVGKLVQKGELAEKDGKTLVSDLIEKRKENGSRGENGNAARAVTSAI